MNGHGEKLSRKQEQAIAHLLTAPPLGEAAAPTGIGEPTLRRWLKQEVFRAAFRDARRAVVQQAIAQLQRTASQAVATLVERQSQCSQSGAGAGGQGHRGRGSGSPHCHFRNENQGAFGMTLHTRTQQLKAQFARQITRTDYHAIGRVLLALVRAGCARQGVPASTRQQ
jgi:hypothetical protein